MDRDDDGVIADGRELFGNATPLSWTLVGPRAAHGLEALEFFDQMANGGNADGQINAVDSVFARLSVWIDTDHDGVSQAGELKSAMEAGIVSIDVSKRESGRRDQFGNFYRFRAPAVLNKDGGRSVRYVYDVFFTWR